MINVSHVRESWTPADEPMFWPPVVFNIYIKSPCIYAANETCGSAEFRVDAVVLESITESSTVSPKSEVKEWTVFRYAVDVSIR